MDMITDAWAATQPRSSWQVGMFGESYQGLPQWLAAQEQPAALRDRADARAVCAFNHAYLLWGRVPNSDASPFRR